MIWHLLILLFGIYLGQKHIHMQFSSEMKALPAAIWNWVMGLYPAIAEWADRGILAKIHAMPIGEIAPESIAEPQVAPVRKGGQGND